MLLIDEIDRADDEFEAFLLEVLSDFQVSIPEIGTIVATRRPVVILTSNRTRDVHDALKRRCFYHWIDFPDHEREIAIIRARVPDLPLGLAEEITSTVALLRTLDLQKPPGIGEALDWASTLLLLGAERIDDDSLDESLGAVIKVREDLRKARETLARKRGVAAPVDIERELVTFAGVLRHEGVPVGTHEVTAAMDALQTLEQSEPDGFYWALRLAMVHGRDELVAFDRAFGRHWTARLPQREQEGEGQLGGESPVRRERKGAGESVAKTADRDSDAEAEQYDEPTQ